MRLIAFDLGTSCGWARADGSSLAWGTLDLRPRRFDGGGMRYLSFRRSLGDMLNGVGLVVFEEVRRHMGVDAAHVYGGLMGVLTSECEQRGIPYRGVPVGTIKRHATGKGNADKVAMIASARAKWPKAVINNDDEADALWLLDFATAEYKEVMKWA